MERPPATAALSRKPSCCYIADDDDDRPDGYAECFDRWLDDMEAGLSHKHRRPSLDFLFRRDLASSPRRTGSFGRWVAAEYGDREPHFLDTCCHCNQPLRKNKDIYMYRGDTAFCSEECRQERIELEEQRERGMSLSSSSSMRGATSPSGSPDPRLHTDTVAVA
ncbi:hypothetical protein MLD38_020841 [Melastoma candidum]|uniref:Uncharacterized protein n=1 Tax=Melastoma candidum TaxID=119954 RepID=A0ACB9QEC3_9MYRT|nr:hypothetical protein MLD38_020841 [Melastoma candidum]